MPAIWPISFAQWVDIEPIGRQVQALLKLPAQPGQLTSTQFALEGAFMQALAVAFQQPGGLSATTVAADVVGDEIQHVGDALVDGPSRSFAAPEQIDGQMVTKW